MPFNEFMLRDRNKYEVTEGYYFHADSGTCYHVKLMENKPGRFETKLHIHQEGVERIFVPEPQELRVNTASELIRIQHPNDLIDFILKESDTNKAIS